MPLKEQWPFRLVVGRDDLTFLLDDGFTFSSKDPGGFEAASFSVPKDLPDTLRGTYVRLDCGLGVAFEGRVSQIQRSLGSRTQIVCEGDGALLADDDASMVFVDRDLTRWAQPSVSRQVNILNSLGRQTGSLSFQVAADPTNNQPGLTMSGTYPWSLTQDCEAWYDAGPENEISEVYISGSDQLIAAKALATNAPPNGLFNVWLSSDDIASAINGSSGLLIGGLIDVLASPAERYAYLELINSGPDVGGSPVSGDLLGISLSNIAVYGTHGLIKRGAAPWGFYPSDIASWVLSQCPGLAPGVIAETDSSGFIVPHSAYYTPVGLDQIMNDVATLAGWHWGVWESLAPLTGPTTPRCDFRPRPALGQFTAFCLRRDTSLCDVREDLSEQYNRAVVNFTDVAGVAGCAIVTMDNPILDQAGIASRTLILNAGTMDQATAAVYGSEALALTYATARVAGSVQIDQAIDGPSGPIAPWLLKPGIDRLRIGDLPSFDAWGAYNDVPLSRMEFSGSTSGFSTSLEVGLGASLVETLDARIQAATFLAAQGG